MYFLQKSSARIICAYFIIKHHEMIGNRSSYDKKKTYIHEIRNKIMKVKNKNMKINNKKHEHGK